MKERSDVGNETKADMKGAMGGSPANKLRGAVDALKHQHEHGVAHEALHGLKSTNKGGM